MRIVSIAPLIILLLPITTVLAADNPMYKDGILTIPIVDTPERPGKYRDVTLQPTPDGSSWQVVNYIYADNADEEFDMPGRVELTVTKSFPVQVFLKIVTDELPNCTEMGPVDQRLTNNQFDIVINIIPPPANIVCTASFQRFTKTLSLPVYGLKAGTYSYQVKGVNSGSKGTFKLTRDNKLPGE